VAYQTKLYIFNHQEMTIFALIGLTTMLLAFTVGVHLAKNLQQTGPSMRLAELKGGEGTEKHGLHGKDLVKTLPDIGPKGHELVDQSKMAIQALDDTLSQDLYDAVTRSGVRMEKDHAVQLPERTRYESKEDARVHSSGSKAEHPVDAHSTQKSVPAHHAH
jgi:hypothetical protein